MSWPNDDIHNIGLYGTETMGRRGKKTNEKEREIEIESYRYCTKFIIEEINQINCVKWKMLVLFSTFNYLICAKPRTKFFEFFL